MTALSGDGCRCENPDRRRGTVSHLPYQSTYVAPARRQYRVRGGNAEYASRSDIVRAKACTWCADSRGSPRSTTGAAETAAPHDHSRAPAIRLTRTPLSARDLPGASGLAPADCHDVDEAGEQGTRGTTRTGGERVLSASLPVAKDPPAPTRWPCRRCRPQ